MKYGHSIQLVLWIKCMALTSDFPTLPLLQWPANFLHCLLFFCWLSEDHYVIASL